MPQTSVVEKGQTSTIIKWVVIFIVILNIGNIWDKVSNTYSDMEQKHQDKLARQRVEEAKKAKAYRDKFRKKTYTLRPGQSIIKKMPRGWYIHASSDYDYKFRALERQSEMPIITPGVTDDDGWYYCTDNRHYTGSDFPSRSRVGAWEYATWQSPGRPRRSSIPITIGFTN